MLQPLLSSGHCFRLISCFGGTDRRKTYKNRFEAPSLGMWMTDIRAEPPSAVACPERLIFVAADIRARRVEWPGLADSSCCERTLNLGHPQRRFPKIQGVRYSKGAITAVQRQRYPPPSLDVHYSIYSRCGGTLDRPNLARSNLPFFEFQRGSVKAGTRASLAAPPICFDHFHVKRPESEPCESSALPKTRNDYDLSAMYTPQKN
jgi:hypothetical protein